MYSEIIKIKDEHIDFQDILDNIHYSYYFEKARHNCFAQSGTTVEQLAKEGTYAVLLDEHIKFKKLVTSGDIEVTCQFSKLSRVKFVAEQQILVDGKVSSTNRCEITCIPAKGGRPFLPESIAALLA